MQLDTIIDSEPLDLYMTMSYLEDGTGRPATMAPNGMVVSPHALASQAGTAILGAGGSAIDAAIATQAVLCVVYPHMTGVGGDGFWLTYDARNEHRHSARGRRLPR